MEVACMYREEKQLQLQQVHTSVGGKQIPVVSFNCYRYLLHFWIYLDCPLVTSNLCCPAFNSNSHAPSGVKYFVFSLFVFLVLGQRFL